MTRIIIDTGRLDPTDLMVSVCEGKRVLISEPTFALYRQVATLLGGEVVSVPLSRELVYDVDALKAAGERTRTPNCPSGLSPITTRLGGRSWKWLVAISRERPTRPPSGR